MYAYVIIVCMFLFENIFRGFRRNIGLQHGQNDPYYAGTMAEGRYRHDFCL